MKAILHFKTGAAGATYLTILPMVLVLRRNNNHTRCFLRTTFTNQETAIYIEVSNKEI